MDTTKPRLGRGLEALLGPNTEGTTTTADSMVPVAKIQPNPHQPRKTFDEDELIALAESIKAHGVIQPLAVRKSGDQYLLVAGERRLRAAQLAGLTEVPVHFLELSEQELSEVALVENLHRTDLNPIEKAIAFKQYIEKYQVTHEVLGQKLSLDRSTVANFIGLLSAAPEVQEALRLGQITLGHAKLLKALPHDQQVAFCREIIMKGVSVAGLTELIKAEKARQDAALEAGEPGKEATPTRAVVKTAHVLHVESELRHHLACKVEIKVKAREKGQIVIGFDSNDEFERLVEALKK
jgi:ParB family chromosome partitioning protein